VQAFVTTRASSDDAQTIAELLERCDPLATPRADRIVHAMRAEPRRADWLVRRRGEPVGTGFCEPTYGDVDGPAAEWAAHVLPGERRRGIGDALWRAVSAHARALGKDELRCECRLGDQDADAFLTHRGFIETGQETEVEIDLDAVDRATVAPPPGVELVVRSERPNVVEGMYLVACEAVPDIPGEDARVEPSFEEWRAMDLDRPDRPAHLCVVALAGDEVVGYGVLGVENDELVSHGLTGVLRAWRGRGVAGAIKRQQIQLAKQHGFHRLAAENELRNAPIRHLNAKLGYRETTGAIFWSGPLRPQ
jgi:GNAT superfamily N-acetyltransferase